MLHPVGALPAGVYWRRRALVSALLLSLIGGGSWWVASAGDASPGTEVAIGTTAAPAVPALEQVVPSLAAALDTPAAAPVTEAAPATEAPSTTAPPAVETPAFVEGQPCTDDMIAVDVVPDPGQAAVGSKPTFTLVVTNTSPVSCTRSLDAGLREVVLIDAAGTRVWGSNDCFPEASSEPRTLAAGEAVGFPVLWSGLSSDPGCTAARVNPPAGGYTVQGRLDTKVGAAVPFTLI